MLHFSFPVFALDFFLTFRLFEPLYPLPLHSRETGISTIQATVLASAMSIAKISYPFFKPYKMEKEIIEGNKVIAEFLGYKEAVSLGHPEQVWHRMEGGEVLTKDLKYHSSWDWLMPVVKKINKLCQDGIVKFSDGCEMVSEKINMSITTHYEIAEVWTTVIELLKMVK